MDTPKADTGPDSGVLGSLLASSEPQNTTMTTPTVQAVSSNLQQSGPVPPANPNTTSGVETRPTIAVSNSESHGSGKPKAFLSMLSEGARTPPVTNKKQSSTAKKGT